MNWKLILALFIIIGITGLLLFSERGRDFKDKYLARYVGILGGYFTKITGKITASSKVNRTLPINIKVTYSGLKGQEFNLDEDSFKVELKYESIYIDDQIIRLKEDDTIEFNTESMTGTVTFDQNNMMTVSGNAGSVELSGMLFLPPDSDTKVSFNLIGFPSSFSIDNFEHDRLILTDISGSLILNGWSPLALQNDKLDIFYLKGSIQQSGDSVNIIGNVSTLFKMRREKRPF